MLASFIFFTDRETGTDKNKHMKVNLDSVNTLVL